MRNPRHPSLSLPWTRSSSSWATRDALLLPLVLWLSSQASMARGFSVTIVPPNPSPSIACSTRRHRSSSSSMGNWEPNVLFVTTKYDEMEEQIGGGETKVLLDQAPSSSPTTSSCRELLLCLNERDRQVLQVEGAKIINDGVARGLLDLQRLHRKWERDLENDLIPLQQAMAKNQRRESKAFGLRIDALVGLFLHRTAASRQSARDLQAATDRVLRRIQPPQEETARGHDERGRTNTRPPSSDDDNDDCNDGTQCSSPWSWKHTNDAWDDWDDDDW